MHLRKGSNLFRPLPLVTHGDVKEIQVSSSHPMFYCNSLYVSFCWNRWKIELHPFFAAVFKHALAWRYSRCASVCPWLAPWRVLCLITKSGNGWRVEFLLSQPSCVFCGNQACPTSTVDECLRPHTFKQYGHWILGEISHHWEAFHVHIVMNYFL